MATQIHQRATVILHHPSVGEQSICAKTLKMVDSPVMLSVSVELYESDVIPILGERALQLQSRLCQAESALHDMTQDDWYQAGRSEALREANRLIDEERHRWEQVPTDSRLKVGPVRGLEQLRDLLLPLAKADALPPERLRVENERMRKALAEIAGLCGDGEWTNPVKLLAIVNRGLDEVPF